MKPEGSELSLESGGLAVRHPDAPVVVVVGAGDAIGSAVMRRFAQEGYTVVGTRRNAEKLEPLMEEFREQGWKAHALKCDARKEEIVQATFTHIEKNIGPIDLCIFNVGANVPMTIANTSRDKFFKIWEMACMGGFLTTREASKYMLTRKRGSIFFTGATASLRGAAGFGAFASAKTALRAMAQSLAKEMGPQNIHVAHLIIDGAVDTEWIRQFVLPMRSTRKPDDIVKPESIADAYFFLHNQSRDCWTFEMDLRPWVEPW